jgi:hypothetical protein
MRVARRLAKGKEDTVRIVVISARCVLVANEPVRATGLPRTGLALAGLQGWLAGSAQARTARTKKAPTTAEG